MVGQEGKKFGRHASFPQKPVVKQNLFKRKQRKFRRWVDPEFVKTCAELVIRKEKIHCTGMGSYKSSRATRGLVRTYWSRKGQKGHQKYCFAIAHKYKWRHCQKVRDHNWDIKGVFSKSYSLYNFLILVKFEPDCTKLYYTFPPFDYLCSL